MSANDLLTAYDFEQFQWKSSSDSGDTQKRLLAGGEMVQDTFNRSNKGDQALFFGVYVDITRPLPESQLVSAARDVWTWLRFQIPTIATRIEIDKDDRPWLVYRTELTSGLKQWADRTLVIHRQDVIDLDAIRNQVEGKKLPTENGDQTWIHLVPGATQAAGVNSFGILFHSHHAPFDGSALRIIFDKYLTQLAKKLGETGAVEESLRWGEEYKNLLPAAFNVLSASEPLPVGPKDEEKPSFSNPYYASLGAVLGGFGEMMQNPYTMKPRPVSDKWPVVRRASTRFTKEESANMLSYLKHSSGGRYTLTQLAHGALVMTIISDNPPTPDAASQKIYNLSLANCRSSLKEPYNSPAGYPGYGLGVYSVNVPVSLFLDENGQPVSLDKKSLAKCMKSLRGAYNEQKKIPSTISFMAQVSEIFSGSIKQAVAANQFAPNQGYAFSSDGQGETYLRGTYPDASGTTVLSISDFFTAVNRTDPGPFFRLWSWKGVIELSVDFNSNSVSSEEAQKHLDMWKKFMLLVQDFSGEDY